MKNEFELLDGEKIIYEGDCSNVKKTNRQYGKTIFTVLTIIAFWFIVFIALEQSINFSTILILLVLILITASLIYGIVYNLFIYGRINDEKYIVTNKRVILIKKGKMKTNFVNNIERIGILKEKDCYCDMLFVFKDEDLMNQIKNNIYFSGIYNPTFIINELLKINDKFHIYDDKPTGIFEGWFK